LVNAGAGDVRLRHHWTVRATRTSADDRQTYVWTGRPVGRRINTQMQHTGMNIDNVHKYTYNTLTHIETRTHAHIHIRTRTHTHTHTNTHTHTQTHTHTHTHNTHTHTHTYARARHKQTDTP